MKLTTCVILCVVSFVSKRYVDGKILRGQLVTDKNWAFLARFCFLSEKGKFQYNFTIGGDPDEDSSVNLLLYYDSPTQWTSVYPSNRSCDDKQSILRVDRGQIVPLYFKSNTISDNEDATRIPGCKASKEISETGVKAQCSSYREFRSSRPRWWFIAVADCSSRIGLNVTYSMSLTNGSPGSFWRQHFSADEFYILPELIGAAGIYVILLVWSIYTANQLRLRRLLHLSYRIFVMSIICQLLGLLCEIYGLTKSALSGIDAPSASLMGGLFEAYSETLFTVLMLLLALGYTVTKSELTRRQVTWLLLFLITSVILQMSLFIYQSDIFDPGLVLYIYESPPGYGLLTIKIITWLVFVTCCFRTSRKTTTKYHFYASLLSLGSVWFLCHPITVLAITLLVEKWIRESVVKGCSLWIVLMGHAMFLYVTRPSSTNERFPFHIRTCQVVPAGVEQNHNYEPRRQTRTIASLFTVSHITQNSAQTGR